VKKETIIRYSVLLFFSILFIVFSLRHFIEDLNLPENIDLDLLLNEISAKYNIEFHTQELRDYVANFKHSSDHEEDSLWDIDQDISYTR